MVEENVSASVWQIDDEVVPTNVRFCARHGLTREGKSRERTATGRR
jgi:hypothetical protein